MSEPERSLTVAAPIGRRIALATVILAGNAFGTSVCRQCHQAIYDSYAKTPMARSSGAVDAGAERFERAAFEHAATGFRYRVYRSKAGVLVEFAKADGSLSGTKQLRYFIGSGATARSYAIADDGFLFEAPVAYYAASAKWDMAPGYQGYAYPYLTRPVVAACLNCHASGVAAVPQTLNRFAMPPFAEAGIACERCHGPGDEHVRKMRAGSSEGGTGIVNPAKLDAERRDSVCAQCHLTGEVRVMRAGRDWQSYRAGERLADSIAVFVRSGTAPGMRVTSHMEKLAQSACKRGAGDRLWCGTCHDPHRAPAVAEIRKKCLGCHTAVAKHGDDCIGCHMPKGAVADAQHVVYTDHSIPRRPRGEVKAPNADAELVAFGGGAARPRDLALAYGIVAGRTHAAADRKRALELLQAAERTSPDDVEVLLYLAEIYRNGDRPDLAVPLYRRAIRLDPGQATGSVGLGGIMMERGELAEAIRLWEDALKKNSGLELVRINLAMAQWKSGDRAGAEASLAKAVEMSPGFAAPMELLKKLR